MEWVISIGLFTQTRDDVDQAIDSVAVKAMALCVPDSQWARHAAQHPLGKGFTGVQDLMPWILDKETALSYIAQVPRTLMRDISVNGTPDEIIEQVAVWRDHGPRYVTVLNLSALQPKLRKGLAATGAPTLKVLRGLKKL